MAKVTKQRKRHDPFRNNREHMLTIAFNMRTLLHNKKISMYRLAQMSGVAKGSIKHIAAGDRMPGANVLYAIGEKLGEPVNRFFQPVPKETMANLLAGGKLPYDANGDTRGVLGDRRVKVVRRRASKAR